MNSNKTNIDLLRSLSTSPYNPEPAKKSLLVNCFMKLAALTGKIGQSTPHLFKGADMAKVEWEYKNAPHFFNSISKFTSIGFLDHKDVLDVGCGWGGKTLYFSKNSRLNSICGFDLPNVFVPAIPAEFAVKKKLSNCFFMTGYAENIPYKDRRFDIIIMEDVLEHVTDPEKVFQECYRVLKTNGVIIVKFPSFKGMYTHHLDRALSLPGLHYILPMKTWASGLNYNRLESSDKPAYEPFDEIVATKYCSSITRNLNGLHFDGFKEIIGRTNFSTQVIELVPYSVNAQKFVVKTVYDSLFKIDILKERLANFILYIGTKHV